MQPLAQEVSKTQTIEGCKSALGKCIADVPGLFWFTLVINC